MSLSGPHGFKRDAVDTVAKFTLMEEVVTKPNSSGIYYGAYQYAQAGEAINVGDACVLTPLGQATMVDTTASGAVGNIIGIAQATLANDEYGWFWRGCGVTEATVETGTTSGLVLTTTGTDGTLGTGGDRVVSAFAVDANATGSDAVVTIAAFSYIGTN